MLMQDSFELIITVVNRGHSDEVMDAAKAAGASGGTIITARGAGVHEAETFFGIAIQPEKEVVLILIQKDKRQDVMKEICKRAGLTSEGHGLSFSLPVDEVMGITHLSRLLEEKDQNPDEPA